MTILSTVIMVDPAKTGDMLRKALTQIDAIWPEVVRLCEAWDQHRPQLYSAEPAIRHFESWFRNWVEATLWITEQATANFPLSGEDVIRLRDWENGKNAITMRQQLDQGKARLRERGIEVTW